MQNESMCGHDRLIRAIGALVAPRPRWAAAWRLVVVVGILTAFTAAFTLPTAAPRAAAGEPGATPFLQVRIDQVTPQTVTTTSEPVVTVAGTVVRPQRRLPPQAGAAPS